MAASAVPRAVSWPATSHPRPPSAGPSLPSARVTRSASTSRGGVLTCTFLRTSCASGCATGSRPPRATPAACSPSTWRWSAQHRRELSPRRRDERSSSAGTTSMRLGILVEAEEGLDWDSWRRMYRLTERLGFESVWISDHFQSPWVKDRHGLDPWIALAVAAADTRRVQLGPLVSP